MARVNLTAKFCESKSRIPETGRADYQDALVPGLALRVTANGHRSFVLVARYPTSPKNPTRRALGDYGELTLEEAREKAREWLALLTKGVDPKIEAERQRAEVIRKQRISFAAVAEEFLRRYVKGPAWCELERLAQEKRAASPALKPATALRLVLRDPANAELVAQSKKQGLVKKQAADSILRSEFIKRWGIRPIADVHSQECAAAIRAIVDRGTPEQARTAYEWLRRLFSWAIGTNEFGLSASPVATLRPADMIGAKTLKDRVLTEAELRAVWQAGTGGFAAPKVQGARLRAPTDAAGLGYPYGPLVRMLILTGQRLREVADMQWSEVDLEAGLWTIPASRMKGNRAHEVPLAPDALALLQSLPRFAGPYVFSTTGGLKPVNGFSKAKSRLDELSKVEGFTFHDLRRTMRTQLSALPVPDMVRELVIAHAQPGLHKVYDQHSYREEKRQCLELWENRLRGILAPKPPAEVADLSKARAERVSA